MGRGEGERERKREEKGLEDTEKRRRIGQWGEELRKGAYQSLG